VVDLVLGLVEERSDEVEDAVTQCQNILSFVVKASKRRRDSRADDGSNKSPPRQTAVPLPWNELASRPKSSSILFTTRPTGTAIRSGKNRNSDESADEAEIQEHQRPADQLRLVLQEAAEQHGNEGVEDRGGEDSDDSAVGCREAAAAFGWILLDDFDEARGEEADGDNRRHKLDEAQDTLEPEVKSGLAEARVGTFDAHDGWLGEGWFW
jgi:hypothetical protein